MVTMWSDYENVLVSKIEKHRRKAGSIVGQSRRRWPTIEPALRRHYQIGTLTVQFDYSPTRGSVCYMASAVLSAD